MLKHLANWWQDDNRISEILRSPVDLVVPICYGVVDGDQLAVATVLNFRKALHFYVNFFPKALFAFGNCSYIFNGSEKAESRLKRKEFPFLDSMEVLETTLKNSVDEAENVAEAVRKKRATEPKCILIITGQLHSRSARFIWQKVFPASEVLISCIHYTEEVQGNSPVPVMRTTLRWALANVARHLLLLTVGLSIRDLHHNAEAPM